MAMDKVKLLEKLKGLSEEDKEIFRETYKDVFPETVSEENLSPEEVSAIREVLSRAKGKRKGKGLLDEIDKFFGLD